MLARLGCSPAAFEAAEDTGRIYRALAVTAGVRGWFATGNPQVEGGCLTGAGRGYAVLGNHYPAAQEVSSTSSEK